LFDPVNAARSCPLPQFCKVSGAFALNDEMLENFAFASCKKVKDVAVNVMRAYYARTPQRMYYFGGSEGGREGLTMAQRFPADYDGIVSIVPVINWTGLFHAFVRNQVPNGLTAYPPWLYGHEDSLDGPSALNLVRWVTGMGLQYHEALVARLGAAAAEKSVRLYVSPGSTHSGNSRGVAGGSAVPTMVDLLDPLDRWVSAGDAPANALVQVVKAPLPPFGLQASRPMCRHPGYPHYVGGDRTQASNCQCRAP
jgi:pimeloyl-ACP methyl ester carboxylesterase